MNAGQATASAAEVVSFWRDAGPERWFKKDIAMLQGDVMECAAVGVPDAHSSEAVKLYVVKKSPELTEQELRDYMHGKLAGYKMPKYIEFRPDLPKTNVGKILRRALRDGA